MAGNKLTPKERLNIQFWVGVALLVAGIALLFMGFWTIPIGEISNSVLIAFGEVLTFVGSLFGIDYKYKTKVLEYQKDKEDEETDSHQDADY